MKLAGRVALVTGAQQGIGAAIAVALAEEWADVTITWLDDERAAEAVAGRIRQVGRRVGLRGHLGQPRVHRGVPQIINSRCQNPGACSDG